MVWSVMWGLLPVDVGKARGTLADYKWLWRQIQLSVRFRPIVLKKSVFGAN